LHLVFFGLLLATVGLSMLRRQRLC
jgi:hypothetical protein